MNSSHWNTPNKPYIYGQLLSDQGAKTIQWGKEQSLRQMAPGQLDIHMQRMKLDSYVTPYTKTNK